MKDFFQKLWPLLYKKDKLDLRWTKIKLIFLPLTLIYNILLLFPRCTFILPLDGSGINMKSVLNFKKLDGQIMDNLNFAF